MSYLILPKRVFNSPLIEFVNFLDGSHINLIRLIKPYADGTSYAVDETTNTTTCSNGLFKTYEEAKQKFDLMVLNHSRNAQQRNKGILYNNLTFTTREEKRVFNRLNQNEYHFAPFTDERLKMREKWNTTGEEWEVYLYDRELKHQLTN